MESSTSQKHCSGYVSNVFYCFLAEVGGGGGGGDCKEENITYQFRWITGGPMGLKRSYTLGVFCDMNAPSD